jgi:predicted deacylase
MVENRSRKCQTAAMIRLGRNRGGYLGETIDLPQVLRDIRAHAHRLGWRADLMSAESGIELLAFSRPPLGNAAWTPRIYVSSGIHGDEPAGPLAIQRLFQMDAFPPHAWFWCCPCLNPTGFVRGTREAASGHDLNRDYRHRETPEVRAHVAWLQRQPMFDAAFCLHEDWEADGFYVYELNPTDQPSLAKVIVDAVREVCPIDLSTRIDGREAHGAVIRPCLDPVTRPEWPEAFYLIQNKTRLSYTLEAASDYALHVRVCALEAGLRAAFNAVAQTPSRTPESTGTQPPP